eukprot:355943-Chlamydomonas_euryale.AAC.17
MKLQGLRHAVGAGTKLGAARAPTALLPGHITCHKLSMCASAAAHQAATAQRCGVVARSAQAEQLSAAELRGEQSASRGEGYQATAWEVETATPQGRRLANAGRTLRRLVCAAAVGNRMHALRRR